MFSWEMMRRDLHLQDETQPNRSHTQPYALLALNANTGQFPPMQ